MGRALNRSVCHHQAGLFVSPLQDRAVAGSDRIAAVLRVQTTDKEERVWSLDVGDERTMEALDDAHVRQHWIEVSSDVLGSGALETGGRDRNPAPTEGLGRDLVWKSRHRVIKRSPVPSELAQRYLRLDRRGRSRRTWTLRSGDLTRVASEFESALKAAGKPVRDWPTEPTGRGYRCTR
jgi:hypothetical protein